MLPTKIRVALWKANERRCFFCSEPISFGDLDVDHLIPRKIRRSDFADLCKRLRLRADFDVGGLYNLVPTHHDCNKRKAGGLFPDEALVFYLDLWRRKQKEIDRELQTFERIAARDRYLIGISKFVESGEMTKQEILQFVANIPQPAKSQPHDPLVITFGVNVIELAEAKKLPKKAGDNYAAICDWLEKDLLFRLSGALPALFSQTEASERNGETLSVRIAFWNLDLDRLDQLSLSNWEIVEVANFSELYETSAEDLLAKAVVKASTDIVSDPWDTAFGVGRCPRCGSDKLNRFSTTDHYRDETYYTVECTECGWSEWTQ